MDRNATLANRLSQLASHWKMRPTEVGSLKLRVVIPDAPHGDVFGLHDGDGYAYLSEYTAARSGVSLSEADPALKSAIAAASGIHPADAETRIAIVRTGGTTAVWVEHETGLEILAAVESAVAIVQFALDVWDRARNQTAKNCSADESDRYWKNVSHVRIEWRRVDGDGKLVETLIYRGPIDQPLPKNLPLS